MSRSDLEAFREEWVGELEARNLLPPTREPFGVRELMEEREISVATTGTMHIKSHTRESTATLRAMSELPTSLYEEYHLDDED